MLSREISHDQQRISLVSKSSAEQRIAALLVSLSRRYEARKLAAHAISLPMSRTDMGNFLGLTDETVSRVLSRLQSPNAIHVNRKEMSLLDYELLLEIAEDSC